MQCQYIHQCYVLLLLAPAMLGSLLKLQEFVFRTRLSKSDLQELKFMQALPMVGTQCIDVTHYVRQGSEDLSWHSAGLEISTWSADTQDVGSS